MIADIFADAHETESAVAEQRAGQTPTKLGTLWIPPTRTDRIGRVTALDNVVTPAAEIKRIGQRMRC